MMQVFFTLRVRPKVLAMRTIRTMVTAVDPANELETEPSATPRKRRETIPGRATPEGTEKFVIESGIKLFHKFEVSKLFVNPIIHGPPRLIPLRFRKPINQRASDNQLLTAVHRNWSNMVYVYNHYSSIHVAGFWSTNALRHIMLKKEIKGVPNPHYRPRESLVTVAGLGLVSSYEEIIRRMDQARHTTRLETIDFAIVECNDDTFNAMNDGDELPDSIRCLEDMCKAGTLQSYGVNITVKPYSYHVPPLKRSGNLLTIPALFEGNLRDGEMPYADLMVYPICPTHSTPHTYPMLDPDPAMRDGDDEEGFESNRKFARAAQDPLLCFRGGDVANIADPVSLQEASNYSQEDLARDSNKVYLDPMDDPTIVAAIQRGLDDDKIFADEYTKVKNEHPELDKKEIMKMVMLNRDIADRMEVRNSIRVKLRSADIASEARRLKELSRTPDLILLSGLRDKEFEDYFAKELDAHCILLETTPKLQDKGLRLAFSVGCELAIIDAETSAMLRKLTLCPSDLLTADETGDLFGEFGVQSAEQEDSDSDSDSDSDDDVPMKEAESKTDGVDK